jgi:hypothetical protein
MSTALPAIVLTEPPHRRGNRPADFPVCAKAWNANYWANYSPVVVPEPRRELRRARSTKAGRLQREDRKSIASHTGEIDAAFCDLWPRAARRTHGDQRPTLHQSADTDCLVGTSAIYANQEYAEAGGLMTYATSIAEIYHQLGSHTGHILKGDRPADLPVVVQCDCAYRSPRFTS